ncbi:HPr family phosphocarrier protein [Xylanimonas sp. McL0601]|uniref:HPr family phosphocarrier protein n=1 Tax=Xylanimonas sp. McL0601 TaxID=3414739 RepID=UPI003CF0C795
MPGHDDDAAAPQVSTVRELPRAWDARRRLDENSCRLTSIRGMERVVVVRLREGLHARPAALFVREAGRQHVPLSIARPGGDAVAAGSILGVLTLDVSAGDEVVLSTPGTGAEDQEALDALERYLSQTAPA